MEQWEVARCTSVCSASGRELVENEPIYAVLYDEGDTFRREDYSIEDWPGPPADCYCFFKTSVPAREKKKRLLLDDEVLISFFTRLADETLDERIRFRFVLALILMRKRILKYEQTTEEECNEVWHMRLVREQSIHKVVNPHLDDSQIDSVSRQLGAILHGDMGDFDELDATEESDSTEVQDSAVAQNEVQSETDPVSELESTPTEELQDSK